MIPVLIGVTLWLQAQARPADSLGPQAGQTRMWRPIVFECAVGAFETCASQSLVSRLSPDMLGFTVVISQPGFELTLPYGAWGRGLNAAGGGAAGGGGGGRGRGRGRRGRGRRRP